MNRAEVYNLIDGERDYQERIRVERDYAKTHSLGDYLVLIYTYFQKACQEYTVGSGDHQALAQMRKISALTVACMEEHGAPAR